MSNQALMQRIGFERYQHNAWRFPWSSEVGVRKSELGVLVKQDNVLQNKLSCRISTANFRLLTPSAPSNDGESNFPIALSDCKVLWERFYYPLHQHWYPLSDARFPKPDGQTARWTRWESLSHFQCSKNQWRRKKELTNPAYGHGDYSGSDGES